MMRPIILEAPLFRNHADDPQEHERSRVSMLALLDWLAIHDRLWLQMYPGAPDIYDSGVRYVYKDSVEAACWQDIAMCLAKKTGDCKDFAAWRVAELRERYGVDCKPAVLWRLVDGSWRFHAVVEFPDGTQEDPSLVLGMKSSPRGENEVKTINPKNTAHAILSGILSRDPKKVQRAKASYQKLCALAPDDPNCRKAQAMVNAKAAQLRTRIQAGEEVLGAGTFRQGGGASSQSASFAGHQFTKTDVNSKYGAHGAHGVGGSSLANVGQSAYRPIGPDGDGNFWYAEQLNVAADGTLWLNPNNPLGMGKATLGTWNKWKGKQLNFSPSVLGKKMGPDGNGHYWPLVILSGDGSGGHYTSKVDGSAVDLSNLSVVSDGTSARPGDMVAMSTMRSNHWNPGSLIPDPDGSNINVIGMSGNNGISYPVIQGGTVAANTLIERTGAAMSQPTLLAQYNSVYGTQLQVVTTPDNRQMIQDANAQSAFSSSPLAQAPDASKVYSSGGIAVANAAGGGSMAPLPGDGGTDMTYYDGSSPDDLMPSDLEGPFTQDEQDLADDGDTTLSGFGDEIDMHDAHARLAEICGAADDLATKFAQFQSQNVPLLTGATALIPGVGPLLAPLTPEMVKASNDLIYKAEGKDPSAVGTIQTLKAQAKQGDESALSQLDAINRVNKAKKLIDQATEPKPFHWTPWNLYHAGLEGWHSAYANDVKKNRALVTVH